MDNYPVNDYAQDRILLGPYTGREPGRGHRVGRAAGQRHGAAPASRIPLFTAADYAWNPRGYRPDASWRAAITDLAAGDPRPRGGPARPRRQRRVLGPGAHESAYLRPLIDDVLAGPHGDGRLREPGGERAAERQLRSAFTVMRETPDRLRLARALAEEVAPWTEQLAGYGEAGETAVDMLRAQRAGDTATAWQASSRSPARRALASPRPG